MASSKPNRRLLAETATAAKIAVIPALITVITSIALSFLLGTFVAHFAVIATSLTTGTTVQVRLYSDNTEADNQPKTFRLTFNGRSVTYFNTNFAVPFNFNLSPTVGPGVYSVKIEGYLDKNGNRSYIDQTVFFSVSSGQLIRIVPIGMQQRNIVANSSFEAGLEPGWYELRADQATYAGQNDIYRARSGTVKAKVQVTTSNDIGSGGIYKQYTIGTGAGQLLPNVGYTVSSWFSTNKNENWSNLYVRVRNGGITLNGNNIAGRPWSEWHKSSLFFTTPPSGTVDVYFGYGSGSDLYNGNFYLEDISLERSYPPAVGPYVEARLQPIINNPTIPQGSSDYALGSVILDTAQSTEDMAVSSATFLVTTQAPTFPALVTSPRLFNGTTTVGHVLNRLHTDPHDIERLGPGTSELLTIAINPPVVVPRGNSKTLVLRGDVNHGSAAGRYTVTLRSVTANGVGTGALVSAALLSGSTSGVTIATSGSGSSGGSSSFNPGPGGGNWPSIISRSQCRNADQLPNLPDQVYGWQYLRYFGYTADLLDKDKNKYTQCIEDVFNHSIISSQFASPPLGRTENPVGCYNKYRVSWSGESVQAFATNVIKNGFEFEGTILKNAAKPACCSDYTGQVPATDQYFPNLNIVNGTPFNEREQICCDNGSNNAHLRPVCTKPDGSPLHTQGQICRPGTIRFAAGSDGCCPSDSVSSEVQNFINSLPAGCSLTITAASNACHTDNSTHYSGCAVDIQNAVGCNIAVSPPGDYGNGKCTDSGDHIHCQVCERRPSPTPTPNP